MTIPNVDDAPFLREGVVDINPAVVGISKNRWTAICGSEATEERAAAKMRERKYDILPINDGAEVKRYFRTKTWGVFCDIVEKQVSYRDVIPFDTNIRDVIRGLAQAERLLFFWQTNEGLLV